MSESCPKCGRPMTRFLRDTHCITCSTLAAIDGMEETGTRMSEPNAIAKLKQYVLPGQGKVATWPNLDHNDAAELLADRDSLQSDLQSARDETACTRRLNDDLLNSYMRTRDLLSAAREEVERLKGELHHMRMAVRERETAYDALSAASEAREAALREALEGFLECPRRVDEATVPKDGIEAAPQQVVFLMSASLMRFRKAEAALRPEGAA